MRNNRFFECNNSPELNWSIELKLEASPTAPGKKLMTDQDIWIQHAAINSLNAVFGQKDSTEHETNFREYVVKNRTKSGIKEPKSVCELPKSKVRAKVSTEKETKIRFNAQQ